MSERRPTTGERAYDPATGRTGVVMGVHSRRDLLYDDRDVHAPCIAFLRPEGGGLEWEADASALEYPVEGS